MASPQTMFKFPKTPTTQTVTVSRQFQHQDSVNKHAFVVSNTHMRRESLNLTKHAHKYISHVHAESAYSPSRRSVALLDISVKETPIDEITGLSPASDFILEEIEETKEEQTAETKVAPKNELANFSGASARGVAGPEGEEYHPNRRSSSHNIKLKNPTFRQEMRQVFGLLDLDSSGSISAGELKVALTTLLGRQFSDDDVQCIIKQVDTSGKGHVDFESFYRLMHGFNEGRPSKEDLQTVFALLDKDSKGVISCDQLSSMLTKLKIKLDKSTLQQLIESVAKDPAAVSFEEFVLLVS